MDASIDEIIAMSMNIQNLMAKALYDNMPESPEELAFRKGDILTVIEQNTGGLEGWWLCSLHGRQGIAPGNRLKLLIGPMFEAQSPAAAAQSPPQSSAYQQKAGSGGAQGIYQVPPSLQSPQSQQSIYQVPPAQDIYQVCLFHAVGFSPVSSDSGAEVTVFKDGLGSEFKDLRPWASSFRRPSVSHCRICDESLAHEFFMMSSLHVKALPPLPSKHQPHWTRRRVLKPTVYVSALTPQALRDDVYRDRNANNGRVVTPTRVGQSYTFSPGQHNQQDLYDVPPSRSQGVYDIPPGQMFPGARNQGVYDVPPSQMDARSQGVYDVYSVPPCRTNPAVERETTTSRSLSNTNRKASTTYPHLPSPSHHRAPMEPPAHHQHPSTNGNEGIYDVPPPALHTGAGSHRDIYDIPRGMPPPQHRTSPNDSKGIYDIPAQDARAVGDVTDGVNRLSFSSTGSTRSSMSTSSSSAGSHSEGRLVLDVDTAVQRLCRLQQGVEASVGALHSMSASPHWRTFPFMERHANDVRTVLDRVRAALGDFVVFGRGAAANATALSDSSLHCKLRRQLGRLEDSQQILLQIYQVLENCSWALNALAASAKHHNKSDDLDRFVMVSRTVPDDAKQLASTIGSSAELLFRRTHMDGSFSIGSSPDET
ncbi:hypothetical protein F7725_025350 [Dissostichus mawsoni]|uniref:SH3 domain-containing protein n=1 Tax=Dissostichus mawsoni TaxID=36200 RepID=A0A7J5XAW3_DISMA|nr:hypothetical protein F7725_025350 [Dissostichus mawsoni]